MSDTNQCGRWSRVLAGVEPATDNTEDLLDHLEGCVVCQRAAWTTSNPARMWHVLAGDQGDAAAALAEKQHLAARRAHQDTIISDVKDKLLPNLSVAVREAWLQLDPLAVFRALDAVALLVRNYSDSETPAEFVLQPTCDVRLAGRDVIPRSTVEREVARSTGTSADGRGANGRGAMSQSDVSTFCRFVTQAARDNRFLFLGLESTPEGGEQAALKIVPRDNATNLGVRWLTGAMKSRENRETSKRKELPLRVPSRFATGTGDEPERRPKRPVPAVPRPLEPVATTSQDAANKGKDRVASPIVLPRSAALKSTPKKDE
jgi:hypothetical protein